MVQSCVFARRLVSLVMKSSVGICSMGLSESLERLMMVLLSAGGFFGNICLTKGDRVDG